MKALTDSIKLFESFEKGSLDDYAATKAALITTVSNSPVEGLNSKLKMLKQQMYSRASLYFLAEQFIFTV